MKKIWCWYAPKINIVYKQNAHNDAERRGLNAEKRLEPNQNKTKQLKTEHSRKMYGLRLKFTSIETEYHRMSIFCYLHYFLRLEKHGLNFSSENIIFQESNTAYLFVFTRFFGDFRRTLWLLLLKISYFNSPEHNLASPLKKKNIEFPKSSIIPTKVLYWQKVKIYL